ncbi:MAG: TIGR01777 family oxidoreductase, partial [Candidatus Obscuribacterales bacterium]|nr:TIGR01777 family oxidoreductase [Candidatus Obscuribacterales bacterium]
MKKAPRVFVCASAIGYYGDRGSETLTEESGPGLGFLAEVCKGWEEATAAASAKGVRTVKMRIGVVLSKKGGALSKMLPPFVMGAGGVLGSGRQYMSWISLDDLVEAIYFAIKNDSVSGPVNAVTPNPVTNAEFTRSLGKALGRPTIFPVPAFGAKLLFGEMAQEMLLSGARILPSKLESAGFKYHYPGIDGALQHALHESAN